jgi:hypothetical protein
MGQIARFDTYLDMCFISMIASCEEWQLFSAVLFFVVVYLTFPVYTLFKQSGLHFKETEINHVLATIERSSKLAFIRESMLLATVLDSFCISNDV